MQNQTGNFLDSSSAAGVTIAMLSVHGVMDMQD